MDRFAINVIEALGGTTAVAGKTDAPVTTVQSWKTNGIPRSRLSHLKLIASNERLPIDWTTGLLKARDCDGADHEVPPSDGADSDAGGKQSPDKSADRIGTATAQVAA